MSAIDYIGIANSGLEGLAFGFFFFGIAYLLFRALMFEVLGSPVVQAIGRAAATLAPKGAKGGMGTVGQIVASKGMDIAAKFFGVEPPKNGGS